MSETMKCGAELIADERRRQIEVEGWTPKHDDVHGAGELVMAAVCYAEQAVQRGWLAPDKYRKDSISRFSDWPWGKSWWKPKDPISDLAKAAALIAAEIDRLQRAKASTP